MKSVIIIFFFYSLFVPQNNLSQLSDTIEYNDTYKLKWDDFQGIPRPKDEKGAETVYKIALESNTSNTSILINVRSLFLREESWKKNGVNDNYSLNHEQGHFDLTEIFARIIRQKISSIVSIKSIEVKENVNQIFKEELIHLDKEQDKYDNETNYSRDREKQEMWNIYLCKKLDELKKFKEISIILQTNNQSEKIIKDDLMKRIDSLIYKK